MQCAICGQLVADALDAVPTADHVIVHRSCADRESLDAWRWRSWIALGQGLVSAVLLWAFYGVVSRAQLTTLTLILLVIHIYLHRHWWRIREYAMRRWFWQRLRRYVR